MMTLGFQLCCILVWVYSEACKLWVSLLIAAYEALQVITSFRCDTSKQRHQFSVCCSYRVNYREKRDCQCVFCHDRGGCGRCYSSFENCSGGYRSVRENCQMKAKWKNCIREIFIIYNTIQRGIQSFQQFQQKCRCLNCYIMEQMWPSLKQIHTKAIKSVISETSVYALRKIIHIDMRQKKKQGTTEESLWNVTVSGLWECCI